MLQRAHRQALHIVLRHECDVLDQHRAQVGKVAAVLLEAQRPQPLPQVVLHLHRLGLGAAGDRRRLRARALQQPALQRSLR